MNRSDIKVLAQMNCAEILLNVLEDKRDTAAVFGFLNLLVYSGTTAESFQPQKMLDKLQSLEDDGSDFKRDLKAVLIKGFEQMLRYSQEFKSFTREVDSLYVDIQAGKYDHERNQDDGSSNRDQTGTNPVS